MAGRKRKFGTLKGPCLDEINSVRSLQESDKSLRLYFDDYTTSDCDSSAPELSIKVFNDPVHGHIEMHPLCTKIIDTPQFQRLRDIKQLGGCYLVFPGASHNRFEHSLGVSYLAGKLCQSLHKKQPSLGITPQDILCVKIAGLCHDLGHGPFSHLFDGIFIPMIDPLSDWKHEHASRDMLDYLIKENDLWPSFEEWGLEEKDLVFIKEMIAGFPVSDNKKWAAKGRDEHKSYLYQIVANKITGIDVDKWDYFARDCYHLGISNNFDYKRFVKFARVVEVDGDLHICTRDKEVGTLYDMFHTRNSLHRRAYQHKTGKILDLMFSEVLLKADPYFLVEGKDGKKVRLSESVNDMVAYSKVSDSVFIAIEMSPDPQLAQAKELLGRIRRRNLYKLIGQTILKVTIPKCKEKETRDRIIRSSNVLNPDDFIVHIINFDYGMKERNPMDFVRFYHKSDPTVAVEVRKDQVSQMLPEQFAENHLRLYCKSREKHVLEEGQRCFEQWCQNAELPTPKVKGVTSSELSDVQIMFYYATCRFGFGHGVCPLYPELTPSKKKAKSKHTVPLLKEKLQF